MGAVLTVPGALSAVELGVAGLFGLTSESFLRARVIPHVLLYFKRPPGVETPMPSHPLKSDAELREEARSQLSIDFNHFNFGITGNLGTGKSSLINAVRGVDDSSPDAAKVGVVQCPDEITKYPYPGIPHVFLWDIPGAETVRHNRDTYFMDKTLYVFDMIIIIVDQLTELDIAIAQNAKRFNVPTVFVRCKSDVAIDSAYRSLLRRKAEVKYQVRNKIVDDIKQQVAGVLDDPKIFVINSRLFGDITMEYEINYRLDEIELFEYIYEVVRSQRSIGNAITNG